MKKPAAVQITLPEVDRPATPDLIKIEKSLNSLGFFTPARKKGHRGNQIRTITYPPKEINGTRVAQRATIIPSREHGQPTTADRDKYMAFMKIVTERRAQLGEVKNPVAFTTYELLRFLGLTDSGTNFREVTQWIDRMVSTTIRSENAVYLNKAKRYAIDIFHVFDRAVLAGQEMEDGTLAQMNYVWLSNWQLENINTNFMLPLDLNSYLQLRRDVSKALFGHLHTWFFASRGARVETRYSYLCELLDIQRWAHLSRIKQALGPSLDELHGIEYLHQWGIERTIDKTDYKLVLYPGARILRITRPRLAAAVARNDAIDPEMDALVASLAERGIREDVARRILLDVPEDQHVLDQVEYFDAQLKQLGAGILNPPGFLVAMIRENWPIPRDFLTTRKLDLRRRLERAQTHDPAATAEARRELRRMEWEEKYQAYIEDRVKAEIDKRFSSEELDRRLRSLKREIASRHPGLYGRARLEPGLCPALDEHARRVLAEEVRATLAVMSFEEFCSRSQQPLF